MAYETYPRPEYRDAHPPLDVSDAVDPVPCSTPDEATSFVTEKPVSSRHRSSAVLSSMAGGRPPSPPGVIRSFIIELPRTAYTSWNHSPFFQRIVFFLVGEAALLIFAIITRFQEIWVREATDQHFNTLTKGLFNVVFISWQTLTLIPALSVVGFVYSSEWYYIYRRDRDNFLPDTTDLVSSLSGGWLDRARYLMSRRPSGAFRLAFVVAVLCTVLAGVGPSMLTMVPANASMTESCGVANITFIGDLAHDGFNSSAAAASKRAGDLLRQSPDNMYSFGVMTKLVPWPSDPTTLSLPPKTNITFTTDVIDYSHQCMWYQPVWNPMLGSGSAVLDGQSYWSVPAFPDRHWQPWVLPSLPSSITSGIFPLVEGVDTNTDATLAFLVLGSNAADPDHSYFSLDNVPSSYESSGFPLQTSQGNSSTTGEPEGGLPKRACILLCDTGMIIGPGYPVVVSSGANMSPGDRNWDSGARPVGNIALKAAVAMMTQMWAYPLQTVEEDMPDATLMNSLANSIFSSVTQDGYGVLQPPGTISSYLDMLAPRAAAAYMDGYTGPNSPKATFTTTCTRSVEVQRLVVNLAFLATAFGLTVSITALLTVAANLPSAKDRQPLDVKTILKFTERTFIRRPPSRSGQPAETQSDDDTHDELQHAEGAHFMRRASDA